MPPRRARSRSPGRPCRSRSCTQIFAVVGLSCRSAPRRLGQSRIRSRLCGRERSSTCRKPPSSSSRSPVSLSGRPVSVGQTGTERGMRYRRMEPLAHHARSCCWSALGLATAWVVVATRRPEYAIRLSTIACCVGAVTGGLLGALVVDIDSQARRDKDGCTTWGPCLLDPRVPLPLPRTALRSTWPAWTLRAYHPYRWPSPAPGVCHSTSGVNIFMKLAVGALSSSVSPGPCRSEGADHARRSTDPVMIATTDRALMFILGTSAVQSVGATGPGRPRWAEFRRHFAWGRSLQSGGHPRCHSPSSP